MSNEIIDDQNLMNENNNTINTINNINNDLEVLDSEPNLMNENQDNNLKNENDDNQQNIMEDADDIIRNKSDQSKNSKQSQEGLMPNTTTINNTNTNTNTNLDYNKRNSKQSYSNNSKNKSSIKSKDNSDNNQDNNNNFNSKTINDIVNLDNLNNLHIFNNDNDIVINNNQNSSTSKDNTTFNKDINLNNNPIYNTTNKETTKIHPYTKYDEEAESKDTDNGTSNLPCNYFNELINHHLSTYYENNLLPRKTFFFTRISNENIMKWQGNIINNPLTIGVTKEFVPLAIQLFKNLMGWMQDYKSKKKPLDHIKKLLRLSISAPQEIKDEVFMHIMKQATKAEYNKSLRAWKAFAIVASTITPSSQLFYSMLNFLLFEIKTNKDENIVKHANFVFSRLYNLYANPRKNIPEASELQCIENLRPILVSVFLFSGEEVKVGIESYTSIRELKAKVMRKMNFKQLKIQYYGIYEIANRSRSIDERILEESNKVVDILSLWSKDMESSFKTRESIEFKFYLKMVLFYEFSDDQTTNFLYNQCVYDFLNSRYDFDCDKSIIFAAVKLYIDFNDGKYDEAYNAVLNNLECYIPYDYIDTLDKDEFSQRIMEHYSEFKSSSIEEAKSIFLDKLNKSDFHKSHQFFLNFSQKNQNTNTEEYPETVICLIKPTEISFYTENKEIISTYKYNNIANWGISPTFFVIVVPENDDFNTKLYFETNQTKVIQHLLESYSNLISSKSIVEVEKLLQDSEKRFEKFPSCRERTSNSYNR